MRRNADESQTTCLICTVNRESLMESIVEEIENAITRLPQDQLTRFRAWYEKFDSDVWDEQIQEDASSGRLDALAEVAIAEHQAGKSRVL